MADFCNNVSKGNCPICGGDNLSYDPIEDCDFGVHYPWQCDDCGATGKEFYTTDFHSHIDVCTN